MRVAAYPDGGFIPFVEITTPEKFQDEADAFGDYRIHPSFVLGCQHEGPGQWEARESCTSRCTQPTEPSWLSMTRLTEVRTAETHPPRLDTVDW